MIYRYMFSSSLKTELRFFTKSLGIKRISPKVHIRQRRKTYFQNQSENICKLKTVSPQQTSLSQSHEETKAEFEKVWHLLVSDLTNDKNFKDIETSLDWLKIVLEKNVPFGKKFRGLALIYVYQYLMPDADSKEDFLTYIMGWVIEIFQAAALIADDMMDASKTRRGQLCWYQNPDVGISAVNDAFLLESIGYHLLIKYFEEKPYILQLLKAVHRNILATILGQSLDTRMSLTMDMNLFTLENYEAIVKYKTSIYTFYAPIETAMIRAGITDESHYESVKDLSLKLGYLFQVQDDFLDCYGNPKITGKIGTDIIDGKCSWLIVKALELASIKQRQVLNTYYGSKNIDGEAMVKSVFEDLNMIEQYRTHETDTYTEVLKLIKALPSEMPTQPFNEIIHTIYKRNK